MYRFQISVHAYPNEALAAHDIELAGQPLPTLVVPHAALAAPLPVTFEAAATALAALERMFIEPDGALVWVAPQGAAPWQVDGVLYDRAGRLLFVDLKGACPADQFDRLLQTFGWPQQPLMFQLVRQAVFLDEPEFRRFAAREAAIGLKS